MNVLFDLKFLPPVMKQGYVNIGESKVIKNLVASVTRCGQK